MEVTITRENAKAIALIYCRVSDKKQDTGGDGLGSQEHLCRKWCAERGYFVETVFEDTKTGEGDFMKRKGMVALLKYLRANRRTSFRVVFDDLKRFARDREFHWTLRRKLAELGATPESPNFRFEDTPEGRFVESVFAAQGALEREQGARQTRHKMQARLERGFAVFKAPVGYRYIEHKDGGSVLVKDERFAGIIHEALEGFALGRFQTQAEIKRFLDSFPHYPRDRRGEVHSQRVNDMLRQPIYAGYVESPQWGVSLRKGQHEGLISFETFTRVQERLGGIANAPARKDLSLDFPLRGSILCADCGMPLTASWSKGSGGQYAYYLCFNKRGCCPSYGKSNRREIVEGAFESFLKKLQPSKLASEGLRRMLLKIYNHHLAAGVDMARTLKAELAQVERQAEQLLDLIVEASIPSVRAAYEKRIGKLEEQKLVISERIANCGRPMPGFDSALRTGMDFLASPWRIWTSGSFEHKRLVLKLALAERMGWSRNEGLRTVNLTLPFRLLAGIGASLPDVPGMASPTRFELVLPP
jgi:site-specific DNA recombinase